MTDRQLLNEFVRSRSHSAFEQLVRRHVDWLYATARRQVGETQAEDVTQAVFLVLARKARTAARQRALSPWLFRVLRYAALRLLRDEARRRHHEKLAADMRNAIEPTMDDSDQQKLLAMLDELVARLREKDRRALILRFYERQSLSEIGQTLGISEEAARKRVARSVEKLRGLFASRGIITSGDVLASVIVADVLHAGPATMAASVTHAVSASPSNLSISLAKGAIQMIRIQQLAMAAVIVLAVGIVGVVGYGLASSGAQPIALATSEPSQDVPRVNLTNSSRTFVAISRDGQRISGFSKTLGQWTPLELAPEAQGRLERGEKVLPVVGGEVAALRIGTSVYAYSPVTGTWDHAQVQDMPAADPIVSQEVAALRSGTNVYAFSALTGKWDRVEVEDKPAAHPSVSQDFVTVNYDDNLYVFSAITGKWSGVDFGGE